MRCLSKISSIFLILKIDMSIKDHLLRHHVLAMFIGTFSLLFIQSPLTTLCSTLNNYKETRHRIPHCLQLGHIEILSQCIKIIKSNSLPTKWNTMISGRKYSRKSVNLEELIEMKIFKFDIYSQFKHYNFIYLNAYILINVFENGFNMK